VKVLVAPLIIALLGMMSTFGPGELALARAEREPKPGDFFLWEFAGGLAGSFAGGIAAALLTNKLLTEPEGQEEQIRRALIGLGTGIAVGSTAGVVLTGSFFGVNGNLLFASMGGVLGTVNAFALIYWVEIEQGQALGPVVETIMVTAIPAFGAATGYNIGAKMAGQSKKGLEEQEGANPPEGAEFECTIPLFELRF
jgi:hypothetical protein